MPARILGSIRFTRLDEMPAAATRPKQNGRNATPAWIGLKPITVWMYWLR